MPIICFFFGFLLNLTGLIGSFNTGTLSTGLLPCSLGLLLILCGLLAIRPAFHGWAIQAALVVGVIGFTATASGFLKLLLVLRKSAAVESPAILSKSATAFLCAIFIARCIQSFIQDRRAKNEVKSGS